MTQPTALYLADVIANDPCSKAHHDAAAAELRRQHEEIKLLRERHRGDNVEYTRMLTQRDELFSALQAMLTHMGMDEDEWNKPTFDQARAAIAKAQQ